MRGAVLGAMSSAVFLLCLSRWTGAGDAGIYAARVAVIMGGVISLTFAWLWWVRATPLALGMVLSWAGASTLLWGFGGRGEWALMALAVYLTGAVVHLRVIAIALPYPAIWFGGTIALAILGAALLMPRA